MPLVALTGGIASGKSTIAARLASHGAIVVDADALTREVQAAGSPVLDELATEFGADVLLPTGELDRPLLGSRVFGNPAALARLNAIVHPAVKRLSQQRFAQARAADPDAVVIYDVPLLAEARGTGEWDLIVVAHAPAAVREQRLVAMRGMPAEQARARIEAQASDDERLALADVVINTAGTLDETLRAADELWDQLRAL